MTFLRDFGGRSASPLTSPATDRAWLIGLALGTWSVWHFLVSAAASNPTLEITDLFVEFLPAYAYQAHRMRELAVPLWNPYQGTGIPFLGTLLAGALYPARLLLLVTDLPTATAWCTLAHLGLLVLGTFVLCRTLGARPAGAAAGAAVFAASCARFHLFAPSWLEPVSWLPVAALAAERVIVTGRWRWVFLLGGSAAMPVLAGGYQVSVYFAYALALFVLAILCDRRRRGARPIAAVLGQLGLGGVLALALAAPQLLPTLAWAREAVRQTTPLTDVQIDPWAFTPWPQMLVRKLWQLTAPGVVFAVVGFATSGRFGAILGMSAAVAGLVSLGRNVPGFQLYHLIPAFDMFRGPGRIFTVLVTFLCAIAVALGVTRLAAMRGLGRGWRRPLFEAVALAVTLAFVLPRMRNDAILPWTSPTTMALMSDRGMFSYLRENAARVALLGAAGDWSVTARQGMMQQVRVLTDYDPLVSRRLREFMRALQGLPIEQSIGLPFTGGIFPKERLPHPQLLDLAAVSHVVLKKGASILPATPAPEWILDYGPHELVRNPTALPRAYLIDRVRVVADAPAALDTIVSASFDGHREAVLVGDPDGADTQALQRAAPAAPSAVRFAVDDPERVAIDFDTDHTALLVLADAYAPGWTVRVDGTPRRLWQVNHLVRGVIVHPSERHAEFTYRAPGFALGLASAALGTFAVALCAALGRRRVEDQP